MKMPNGEALSLFPGGKNGVIERMNSMVKDVLSSKSEDSQFVQWFAEEFSLKEGEFECLRKGKKRIDFEFFEKVKEALNISMHDVLGPPSFNDGEKEYWSKQLKINPMVLAAPAGDSKGEESVQKENRIDKKEIELRFYVRLRAISALLGNK